MKVAIDPSTGTVVIDGMDVSHLVRRTTLDVHAGRQPEVFLELRQDAVVRDTVLDTDAVVHIVQQAEIDLGAAVAAWLDTIDPGDLDRRALEDTSLAETPGAAFHRALRSVAAEQFRG